MSVLFVLVLGLLAAVPSMREGASYSRPIVHSAFVTTFLVSVLVLALMLLRRPAAEQRGDTPDLVDVVIKGVRDQLRHLPLFVVGLGVLDALVDLPRSDLGDRFWAATSELSWDLGVACAATVLVAALAGMVRSRSSDEGGETPLQPATPAACAALLRDGAAITIGLVLAAAVLRILDEVDDIFDSVRGFADTFENAMWFLLALIAAASILLVLAWAIERRHDVADPRAATGVAQHVPHSIEWFWSAPRLTRVAPKAFGSLALAYIVFNFLAWTNLGSDLSGLPTFNASLHLAVLLSDVLWVALFGGLLVTLVAGVRLLEGGNDNVAFLSLQALYAIGAAASLAAIGEYLHAGSGMGLHDALIGTLVARWALGACGIAGLIALRALYWDRTVPVD